MDSTYGQWEVRVVLEEDRDSLSKVPQLESADVVPVDQDLPFLGIVKACDKLENRTLSRPVDTDNDLCNAQSALGLI